MNRSINILLFLLFVPTAIFSIVVGFDLPLSFIKTSGENIPYIQEIYYVLAGLFLIIGARRAIRRWSGLKLVSNTTKYMWNKPMDKKRSGRVSMYLILEGVVHFVFAFILFGVTPFFWPIALVLILLSLDHFIFAIVGKAKGLYRIGITKNAIVFADREICIVYFSGLRSVSIQQDSLYFDYIKELQLTASLDGISPSDRTSFRQTVEGIVDRNVVFFSEGFKNI